MGLALQLSQQPRQVLGALVAAPRRQLQRQGQPLQQAHDLAGCRLVASQWAEEPGKHVSSFVLGQHAQALHVIAQGSGHIQQPGGEQNRPLVGQHLLHQPTPQVRVPDVVQDGQQPASCGQLALHNGRPILRARHVLQVQAQLQGDPAHNRALLAGTRRGVLARAAGRAGGCPWPDVDPQHAARERVLQVATEDACHRALALAADALERDDDLGVRLRGQGLAEALKHLDAAGERGGRRRRLQPAAGGRFLRLCKQPAIPQPQEEHRDGPLGLVAFIQEGPRLVERAIHLAVREQPAIEVTGQGVGQVHGNQVLHGNHRRHTLLDQLRRQSNEGIGAGLRDVWRFRRQPGRPTGAEDERRPGRRRSPGLLRAGRCRARPSAPLVLQQEIGVVIALLELAVGQDMQHVLAVQMALDVAPAG